MSKLINDGLSPALFAALERHHKSYKRTGYLSTTSCLDSPRIRVLTERHTDEIVIPASRLIPSFVGTCVHAEIERWDRDFEIDGIAQEKEFMIEVCGITFSGRSDFYDRNAEEVGDEKTGSVWVYQFYPQGKPEHVAQININAYLLRRNGLPCTKGWVELIFMDWKHSTAKRDPKYPKRVERVFLNTLWPDDQVQAFIEDRVGLHLAADKEPDDFLPLCTVEEKWQKPHVWAVYRKGNARALSGGICESAGEAEELVRRTVKASGGQYRIEERPGERTRCLYHCDVQPWCNQFKEEGNV